jgi:hypothetical protein
MHPTTALLLAQDRIADLTHEADMERAAAAARDGDDRLARPYALVDRLMRSVSIRLPGGADRRSEALTSPDCATC